MKERETVLGGDDAGGWEGSDETSKEVIMPFFLGISSFFGGISTTNFGLSFEHEEVLLELALRGDGRWMVGVDGGCVGDTGLGGDGMDNIVTGRNSTVELNVASERGPTGKG